MLEGSEALCRLVHYLAQHTLNSPTDHLKEYQIAVEVLGRSADFDPQSDASVRVQVGRLRTKIAEYYRTIGTNDPILIDLPKGRYVLSFERRIGIVAAEAVASAPALLKPTPAQRRIPSKLAPTLAVVLLLSAIGAALIVHSRSAPAPANSDAEDVAHRAMTTFWAPFLLSPEKPFLVYSNASFVGSAETGMRYYVPSRDKSTEVTQHYTGVGEVAGVLNLDRLFRKFGRQFHVKRGGLFTMDDARNNNLIFVGSPTENLTLGKLSDSLEFVFRAVPDGPDHWRQTILDKHPHPGNPSTYVPTPTMEYAVISLSRGIDRSHWTMILAGTSTIGTQAVVDYACDARSLQELLRRLGTNSGEVQPFEALLKVKVANDVPLQTELLDVRKTQG